jgi:hypothetical protein
VLGSSGSVLSLASRGVEIIWKLGFYWSSLVYDYLVGRDEEIVPFRARQLRNLLCDLGPSFIKAGQVMFFSFSDKSYKKLKLYLLLCVTDSTFIYLIIYSGSS